MGKTRLSALMISLCLLLTGCGGGEREESRDLRERWRAAETVQAEAELICHYGDEVRTYTMSCDYTPQRAEITVTAPEELAGIAAVLDGGSLALRYDGVLLDAGIYSGTEISPFLAIPCAIRALGEGYLLEESRETVEEQACLRLCLEMTGEDGEKTLYTLWLNEEDIPVRGEITVDGTVVYALRFLEVQTADEPEEP